MKIVLIGPGCMPIPSPGWGAVERIVWDYYQVLSSNSNGMGHEVHIINTSNHNEIIQQCNALEPDVAHIMYDDHISVASALKASKILYTSHFAYLTSPQLETTYRGYFDGIFMRVINQRDNPRLWLNVISDEIAGLYSRYGFPREKIRVMRNGARDDLFRFTIEPVHCDRSIYLGKVEMRKGQYKYQSIPGIDFVGNYHDSPFNTGSNSYKGEWSKERLYQEMTEYGNLILLSSGEADPLVVKEALIAGLGVVVSECASANLDISAERPWITIIPNGRINDLEYVAAQIANNRNSALINRAEIREYGLSKFGWSKILQEYISFVLV
jgi:glycosyltransferase involved in cell wall biosynthesis